MAGAASAEAAQSFGESVKPFGQSLKRPTLFREACRDVLYGTGRRCGAGRSGFCKSRQIADRAGGIVRRNRGASSRRAQHGHVLSYQKKIIKKRSENVIIIIIRGGNEKSTSLLNGGSSAGGCCRSERINRIGPNRIKVDGSLSLSVDGRLRSLNVDAGCAPAAHAWYLRNWLAAAAGRDDR